VKGREEGIALPAAVILLMIVLMLGSVAGLGAVGALSQSGKDRGTKRSVAAIDAGMDTAIYRLNKLTPSALLCVVVGATGLTLEPVQSDGWCRAQSCAQRHPKRTSASPAEGGRHGIGQRRPAAGGGGYPFAAGGLGLLRQRGDEPF
jgi:hypothetical protein